MSGYERFDFGHDEDITEPVGSTTEHQPEFNFKEKKLDYDHIEVSLDDDPPVEQIEDTKEVINRANDFFLENNDNFRLSWKETVAAMDEDLDADPANPPKPGWNWEYVRWKLRRHVESLTFRFATFLLIIIDVIIVIIDLGEPKIV